MMKLDKMVKTSQVTENWMKGHKKMELDKEMEMNKGDIKIGKWGIK